MCTFAALTRLTCLPLIDSVGQGELVADHAQHFINNKAENYPFHTLLNNVMVK